MTARSHLFALVLLAALLLTAFAAGAQDQDPDSVREAETMSSGELLSLAAVLIGDRNYQRARTALARIDDSRLDDTDEELDRVRYHTLSGLIALNLEQPELAEREFESAIEAGQDEPVIWLYLAQARFGQQKYQTTLAALDRAGDAATRLPSVFMMRAQAHWELGQFQSAWQTLASGRLLFPDRAGEFARRQVFLLVDQGLYQEAAEQGLRYLETGVATTDDAIAIGNALRETGQHQQAALILEKARLSDPDHALLGKVLAHVHLDQGRTLAAAEIMRRAAVSDPELVVDAAELFRRADWPVQALTLNAQVIDQTRKLRQRMSILLEMNRFDQAAGMLSDLDRVGLLADEDMRYALAYAFFKSGEFDRAEQQLQQLTRADLFRRAVELRRAMERCAEDLWMCG